MPPPVAPAGYRGPSLRRWPTPIPPAPVPARRVRRRETRRPLVPPGSRARPASASRLLTVDAAQAGACAAAVPAASARVSAEISPTCRIHGNLWFIIRPMNSRTIAFALAALLGATAASAQIPAQAAASRAGVPDTSPFRALDIATPNGFRSASGMPGPQYWQQKASYNITASLDTATHTIHGEETVTYRNNSPDTLRYVWMQVDRNQNAAQTRFTVLSGAPADSGVTIEHVDAVRSARAATRAAPATTTPLAWRVNSTMMRIDLDRPLPPAQRDADRDRVAPHRPAPGAHRPQPAAPRRLALPGRGVVPAPRRVRRPPRLEYRPVHRHRRVLPRVRRFRLQPHPARRLHRHGDRCPAQPGRGAAADDPRASRRRGPRRHHRAHHPPRRDRHARAAPRRRRRDADLALSCRQCPRRRLGHVGELPVGRHQLGRHPLPGALSARALRVLAHRRGHDPPLDHDPLAVVPLSVSVGGQRAGPRRRHGIPDDDLRRRRQ